MKISSIKSTERIISKISLRFLFPIIFSLGVITYFESTFLFGMVCLIGGIIVSINQLFYVFAYDKLKIESVYAVSYLLHEGEIEEIGQTIKNTIVIIFASVIGVFLFIGFVRYACNITVIPLQTIAYSVGYYILLWMLPLKIKFKYYTNTSIYDQKSAEDAIQSARESNIRLIRKLLLYDPHKSLKSYCKNKVYKQCEEEIEENLRVIRIATTFLEKTMVRRRLIIDVLQGLAIIIIGFIGGFV